MYKRGIVIPCYNVEKSIEKVVSKLSNNYMIYLVNDCSIDKTDQILNKLKQTKTNLKIINNSINLGVGGSVKVGIFKAIEDGIEYIIKLDGDDQMDPKYLELIFNKLENQNNIYVKGNRFHDFIALKQMPILRRIGNVGLSFLIRMASGFWKVSDPTNGYFGLSTNFFKKMDLDKIDDRYFFESSLLIEMHYHNIHVHEIPMSAKYGDEESNLSITHSLITFPYKILKAYIRRILIDYFLHDFNVGSVYLFSGMLSFLFGVIYGSYNWLYFYSLSLNTPIGTSLLSIMFTIIGFFLLVNFLNYDVGVYKDK